MQSRRNGSWDRSWLGRRSPRGSIWGKQLRMALIGPSCRVALYLIRSNQMNLLRMTRALQASCFSFLLLPYLTLLCPSTTFCSLLGRSRLSERLKQRCLDGECFGMILLRIAPCDQLSKRSSSLGEMLPLISTSRTSSAAWSGSVG